MSNSSKQSDKNPDVILIGAGIMSATLGVLLKKLEPSLKIEIFERLELAAAESSDAWNNAGTGHAAFCELNYTPKLADGTIDTRKAVKVAEAFEVSRQFWAHLVQESFISKAPSFIRSIPHMSFVSGSENVSYLKNRYNTLQNYSLFKDMQYSENREELEEWIPLLMKGRDQSEPVAATRMELGTDVNFGSLTRCMFNKLQEMEGIKLHFCHEVKKLKQEKNGRWNIRVEDLATDQRRDIKAKFVFIGAGGGSLPLLLKSGIPEGRGFGGFPVSGQWLKCTNPDVIAKHEAKVYGKAPIGAPPMSVPHLDTRIIKGKKELLFGPYAGFSTKFLKNGSYLDLPMSIKVGNIVPMISAGISNMPLTKYLIDQVKQSPEDRLEALKEFVPDAKLEDWELEVAGQRVQVIKKDPKRGGILEFGTEVVSSADGSIAALLGASPGASTAVSIMINLLERCFPEKASSSEWKSKMEEMIPSYGQSLSANPELLEHVRSWTSEVLGLTLPEESILS